MAVLAYPGSTGTIKKSSLGTPKSTTKATTTKAAPGGNLSPSNSGIVPAANPYQAIIDKYSPWFQTWINQDQTYQSAVQSLVAGLRGAYTSDVATPVQQAYMDYGGPLDAASTQAALSGYGAPNLPWDANTTLGAGLPGPDAAAYQSAAQMLLNPALQAQAAANPFSATNTIARQFTQANQNSANVLAGRGLGYSGATLAAALTNQGLADENRATALSKFLGTVGSDYGTYAGAANDAANARISAQGDALTRAIALIKGGGLSIPTTVKPTPSPRAAPTGASAVARAATAASKGWISPNPVLNVNMAPSRISPPTGPAAVARAQAQGSSAIHPAYYTPPAPASVMAGVHY